MAYDEGCPTKSQTSYNRDVQEYNHHRYKYIHTDNKKAKFTYYNQSTHNFNMAVLVRQVTYMYTLYEGKQHIMTQAV